MNTGRARTQFATLSLAGVDIDLEHRLANFLYQQNVPDTDCIRLDARGGVVVVSGELSSQHAKWLCIECCRRVAGVIKIVDELKVAPATVKFPEADQFKAEKDYSPGQRRNTPKRRGRRSMYRGATQPPRLPAAA
jgi:hypothetical protein